LSSFNGWHRKKLGKVPKKYSATFGLSFVGLGYREIKVSPFCEKKK
jgi:hypothetical protein